MQQAARMQTAAHRLTQRYSRTFVRAFTGRVLIATTTIAFLAAGALLMQQALAQRARLDAEARSHVATVATSLGNYIETKVERADSTIRDIIASNVVEQLATPSSREALTARLVSYAGIANEVFHITILDSAGRVVISSAGSDAIGVDLSERRFFAALRALPEGQRYLTSGEGVLGRARGNRIITVGRPYFDRAGDFAGTVYIASSVSEIEHFFNAVKFQGITSASILRSDDTLLLRLPEGAMTAADPIMGSHVFSHDQAMVLVALDRAVVFGPWLRYNLVVGGFFVLLGAAIAAVTRYAITLQERRERAAEAATLQIERLAQAYLVISKLESQALMVQYACDAVRAIVQCAHSVISLRDETQSEAIHAVSPPGRYLGSRIGDVRSRSEGQQRALELDEPVCLGWEDFAHASDAPANIVSWMALPLVAPNFTRLGVLEVFNREGGDFTREDQAICVQWAQLVSVALFKFQLFESQQRLHKQTLSTLARESSARAEVESILSRISEGFITLDHEWRLTYVNESAQHILSLRAEDVLGRAFWDVFPSSRDGLTFTEFHAVVESGEPRLYEVFNTDIAKWLEVRAFPNKDGLSVFFRDATERRKVAMQLQQAQRMETVGQLSGGIAHDFNNLLTVVIGNADNLIEAAPPDSDLYEGLDLIRMAGRRGAELTQRLLAFARRQALEPASVDILQTVSDIKGLVQRAVSESVWVKVVIKPGIWRAMVDPVQLESAILNLALNARDAMPEGGKLTFEAENVIVEEGHPLADELKGGRYVMLAVADSGVGMTPEVLGRAFEPFFTTKAVGKGTGLGLSMVYGLVNQSGGTIKLYSEVGLGTTVKIYLPCSPNGHHSLLEADSSVEDIQGGTEKILLVEDNDLVRAHTRSQLAALGYQIAEAADAAEAVALIESGWKPDLLLTDVVLPGGTNGRQLADLLLNEKRIERVLFMSGYTEDAVLHQGRLTRGLLLLSKPFGRRDLSRKIREALERPTEVTLSELAARTA